MSLKILITGAAGFVGGHLIERMLLSNFKVASFSRHDISIDKLESYVGNIVDYESIRNLILDFSPEVIIHLAGITNRSCNIMDFESSIDSNVKGTLNILKSVVELDNFKKLIVMGTGEEYGQNITPFCEEMRESPVSCYSLSKTMQSHMVEMFSRLYDIPSLILRPSVIYGPRQNKSMFLPALIASLNNNKDFHMTSGEQSRDFIYISDVVEAIIKSIDAKVSKCEILNIGSGEAATIFHAAEMVGAMLGKSDLIKKGTLPSRPNDIRDYCLSIKKAKDILNWAPKVPLKLGLRETIKFYCDTYETIS